ncbi:hypothetical protein [Rhizobium mulingense]|uniref:hypothetical protein n=1 Tax=Rhizobium mulingense TaxID=3031128 RepID=UPI002B45F070|nr:hypothetical protein [Rhizobium sp. MJ21]MEB3047720.1 hypothetical protein [Rhizobium sp. MJ21]
MGRIESRQRNSTSENDDREGERSFNIPTNQRIIAGHHIADGPVLASLRPVISNVPDGDAKEAAS